MPIDRRRADTLATDLIHTLKALSALRQHLPRAHEQVEPAAHPLLFRLLDRPLRVSTLAELVGSDVSTVSRQVARLADAGMVDKEPDPGDRRAQVVLLTAAGRDLVQAIRARRAAYFQQLLRDWEPDDVDTLTGLLARLQAAIVAGRDVPAIDQTVLAHPTKESA